VRSHAGPDLGVTKTHSRPYTSSDNPYSESNFKTLKYRPEFPADSTTSSTLGALPPLLRRVQPTGNRARSSSTARAG
jgi:transposase InsO family protein